MDSTLDHARQGLVKLCEKLGIEASHGVDHAVAVMKHVEKAIESTDLPIPYTEQKALILAALLHDADDRKYSPETATTMENARSIMKQAGAKEEVIEEALYMISLVSCSKNGNRVPEAARERPWLLWPRYADRLEAIGTIGAVRCYQYNREQGSPLAITEGPNPTPRATTREELWKLATPERFQNYQSSGGSSRSMMDHYYDKLLQIARPPKEIHNTYLEQSAQERLAPLEEICLLFGTTGQVPVEHIQAMI